MQPQQPIEPTEPTRPTETILLDEPQILEQAAESPVLRPQKRSERRRNRSRPRWLRRPKLLFGLAGLALALYVMWTAVFFARTDPRFALAAIHVEGNKYAPRSAIQEKLSSDHGQGIFRIPLESRRAEIEKIPWVRSATVARVLPNQIVIFLEERVPVALAWADEGVYLVDEEGVLLDIPPGSGLQVPLIRGLSEREPAEQRRAKMHVFVALRNDLASQSDAWSNAISEVDLSDVRDVKVVVADAAGAILLHLGRERFRDRYDTYSNHIGEWKRKFVNIQSVDLRYEGQVVLNADSAAAISSHTVVPQSTP